MSTELETDIYLHEVKIGRRELSVYYTIKTTILDDGRRKAVVSCPHCSKVFKEDVADRHKICIKEVLAGYKELDIVSKKFVKVKKEIMNELEGEIDETYHLCEYCLLKRMQSVRNR
ncbi:MAG: hypothetical protein AAB822_00230 [Patescibacteria group bacterium]